MRTHTCMQYRYTHTQGGSKTCAIGYEKKLTKEDGTLAGGQWHDDRITVRKSPTKESRIRQASGPRHVRNLFLFFVFSLGSKV